MNSRQPFLSISELDQLENRYPHEDGCHPMAVILRSSTAQDRRDEDVLPILVKCLFDFRLTGTGWIAAGQPLAEPDS